MSIPEGWPTREMTLAGVQVFLCDSIESWPPSHSVCERIFKAMLSAAPTKPEEEITPDAYAALWKAGKLGQRTPPEVELSAPFHEVIPIWMALKMVKVAMEDHNFPTPDDYYVNGVMKRVKKYAATDKLDAAHTPPEVEPIGYVNPRIISILNRRSSTDATIGAIKTTIYSEPLFTSLPSPKASWDAEGNPLNLEAAARDAVDYLSNTDNYPFSLEGLLHRRDNLRKFLKDQ